MACAKCGAVNDAAARYCNHCGTPLTPSARALGPTAVGAPLPLVFAIVCLALVALVGVGGYLGFGLLQRAISAGKADPRPSVTMPPLPESAPAQGVDAPDASFLDEARDAGPQAAPVTGKATTTPAPIGPPKGDVSAPWTPTRKLRPPKTDVRVSDPWGTR